MTFQRLRFRRFIFIGARHLNQSPCRFQSTAQEIFKNQAPSFDTVASIVAVLTGFTGVLFLGFEFFSLREVKVELRDIKREIQSELILSRTDRVAQTARTDVLYNSLIDAQKEVKAQSAESQKQFGEIQKQFAVRTEKEDKKYYDLLLKLEKKWE